MTLNSTATKRWFNEKQLAEIIGVSLSKLRSDRHKCVGIPYFKIGRSVRYALLDVESFMAAKRITPSL